MVAEYIEAALKKEFEKLGLDPDIYGSINGKNTLLYFGDHTLTAQDLYQSAIAMNNAHLEHVSAMCLQLKTGAHAILTTTEPRDVQLN